MFVHRTRWCNIYVRFYPAWEGPHGLVRSVARDIGLNPARNSTVPPLFAPKWLSSGFLVSHSMDTCGIGELRNLLGPASLTHHQESGCCSPHRSGDSLVLLDENIEPLYTRPMLQPKTAGTLIHFSKLSFGLFNGCK